jgi:hypothetical protein
MNKPRTAAAATSIPLKEREWRRFYGGSSRRATSENCELASGAEELGLHSMESRTLIPMEAWTEVQRSASAPRTQNPGTRAELNASQLALAARVFYEMLNELSLRNRLEEVERRVAALASTQAAVASPEPSPVTAGEMDAVLSLVAIIVATADQAFDAGGNVTPAIRADGPEVLVVLDLSHADHARVSAARELGGRRLFYERLVAAVPGAALNIVDFEFRFPK